MGNCLESQPKSNHPEEIADPLLDEPTSSAGTDDYLGDSTTEEIDRAWGVRFNEIPTVFGQDVTYTIEDLKEYLKELKSASLLFEELKSSLPSKKRSSFQIIREKIKSSILGLQHFIDHCEKFPPSILKRSRRTEDNPPPPEANIQQPYKPPPLEAYTNTPAAIIFSTTEAPMPQPPPIEMSPSAEGYQSIGNQTTLPFDEEDPKVREIREKRNLVKQLRKESNPPTQPREEVDNNSRLWGERTDQQIHGELVISLQQMRTDGNNQNRNDNMNHDMANGNFGKIDGVPQRPSQEQSRALVDQRSSALSDAYHSKREKDIRRAEKKAEKKLIKKEMKKDKKGKKIQVLDDHIMRVQIEVLTPPRKGKYCLVLDLDYTLMDYTHYENPDQTIDLSRPYLQLFLTTCYQNYDLVIWSATQMNFIIRKLERLNMIDNPNYKITCALSKPEMIYTQVGKGRELVKALQVIWSKFPDYYSEDNTLHVDDISTNFYLNPKNGVPISAYRENTMNVEYDRELYFLAIYLNAVAQQPFLHNFDHTRWKEVVMCSLWLEVHRPDVSPMPSLEFPFSLPLAEFISGNPSS